MSHRSSETDAYLSALAGSSQLPTSNTEDSMTSQPTA